MSRRVAAWGGPGHKGQAARRNAWEGVAWAVRTGPPAEGPGGRGVPGEPQQNESPIRKDTNEGNRDFTGDVNSELAFVPQITNAHIITSKRIVGRYVRSTVYLSNIAAHTRRLIWGKIPQSGSTICKIVFPAYFSVVFVKNVGKHIEI